MPRLLQRKIEPFINENLRVFPAIAILGPRQCGKSTLAKMLYRDSDNFLYIDLQRVEDRNRLEEPGLFLKIKMYIRSYS